MKALSSTIYRACLMLLLMAPLALAQSGDAGEKRGFQFTPSSFGVSFGLYSASFEYYNRSFWDFPEAMGLVNLEGEVDLHHRLRLRAGVGYANVNSTVFRGEAFGIEESLNYDFIPISISLLPHYSREKLSVFAGPSLDFMNIRTHYTSRSFDTRETGSTMLYGGLAGVSYKIMPRLELSLQGRYVVGEFDKLIIFNPAAPQFEEVIGMTGPQISVGVKRKMN